jgi:hypothetical protein
VVANRLDHVLDMLTRRRDHEAHTHWADARQ